MGGGAISPLIQCIGGAGYITIDTVYRGAGDISPAEIYHPPSENHHIPLKYPAISPLIQGIGGRAISRLIQYIGGRRVGHGLENMNHPDICNPPPDTVATISPVIQYFTG